MAEAVTMEAHMLGVGIAIAGLILAAVGMVEHF
jgi:hypothetical protein